MLTSNHGYKHNMCVGSSKGYTCRVQSLQWHSVDSTNGRSIVLVCVISAFLLIQNTNNVKAGTDRMLQSVRTACTRVVSVIWQSRVVPEVP